MKAYLHAIIDAWCDWCDLIVNGRSKRMREILERSDEDAIRGDWEAAFKAVAAERRRMSKHT